MHWIRLLTAYSTVPGIRLKPQFEMLLNLEFPSKKYDTHEEEVHCEQSLRIILYCSPCFFHFPAPMDIVKYDHPGFRNLCFQQIEIVKGRNQPVIAIYKSKVD